MFRLCTHGDCLLFTEDRTVFRREPGHVYPQRLVTVPDFAKSRQVVHRLSLHTGKDEVVGEAPVGWRCEDLWCDCRNGATKAIVSLKRDDKHLTGVASRRGALVTMRVLGQVEQAWWGSLSPSGRYAVFVNGDAEKDISTVKIVQADAPTRVIWKDAIPGWRRRAGWSDDSSKIVLWHPIWVHDKEHGRRYQRLYQGYRFRIVDVANRKQHAVEPEWSGWVQVAWHPNSKGLFVLANETLYHLQLDTGKWSFIWAFPSEWRNVPYPGGNSS